MGAATRFENTTTVGSYYATRTKQDRIRQEQQAKAQLKAHGARGSIFSCFGKFSSSPVQSEWDIPKVKDQRNTRSAAAHAAAAYSKNTGVPASLDPQPAAAASPAAGAERVTGGRHLNNVVRELMGHPVPVAPEAAARQKRASDPASCSSQIEPQPKAFAAHRRSEGFVRSAEESGPQGDAEGEPTNAELAGCPSNASAYTDSFHPWRKPRKPKTAASSAAASASGLGQVSREEPTSVAGDCADERCERRRMPGAATGSDDDDECSGDHASSDEEERVERRRSSTNTNVGSLAGRRSPGAASSGSATTAGGRRSPVMRQGSDVMCPPLPASEPSLMTFAELQLQPEGNFEARSGIPSPAAAEQVSELNKLASLQRSRRIKGNPMSGISPECAAAALQEAEDDVPPLPPSPYTPGLAASGAPGSPLMPAAMSAEFGSSPRRVASMAPPVRHSMPLLPRPAALSETGAPPLMLGMLGNKTSLRLPPVSDMGASTAAGGAGTGGLGAKCVSLAAGGRQRTGAVGWGSPRCQSPVREEVAGGVQRSGDSEASLPGAVDSFTTLLKGVAPPRDGRSSC